MGKKELFIKQLKSLLADVIELPEVQITDDENYIQSLAITSLGFVKIIVELEERFKVSVNPQEMSFEKFNTLNKIYRYIEGYNGDV